jgi:hypothetical protein
MDEFEAAEIIKQFWLENQDSRDSWDILMVTCPYCGKSDRIKPLTGPASIIESEAWSILSSRDRQPAVCNFCLNVVLISDGTAMMPED